jgi:hypothetical protein
MKVEWSLLGWTVRTFKADEKKMVAAIDALQVLATCPDAPGHLDAVTATEAMQRIIKSWGVKESGAVVPAADVKPSVDAVA